ncbi:MAG TPA: T9SS type A sorting domain-containing protein, partial [Bacteroidia bacterium]|nr:T9SS type A sorting domain-containing protein [Bacteroidia bacterium]
NVHGQDSTGYMGTNYVINLCKQSKLTLTASGLSHCKWLPTNDTTISIIQYPTGPVSYSVQGYDASGCLENGSVNIFVDSLTITPSILDTPICVGSQTRLNASISHSMGSWFSTNWYSSNGTTLYSYPDTIGYANIPSAVSTYYFVVKMPYGFHCSDSASITVNAQHGCVWPGDSDDNLVADHLDFLPIGIKFGETGLSRAPGSQNIFWKGHTANDWADTLTNGKNVKYVDANGDGTIGFDDTLAVYNNYTQTHLYRLAAPQTMQQDTVHDIYIKFSKPVYSAGDTLLADVYIGQPTNPQSNFYGAAFTVNYDNTKIGSTFGYWFINSWVGINPQKIQFARLSNSIGQMNASLVRITHTDTGGYGKIGTFKFILRSDVSMYYLPFTITNQVKIDHMGNVLPLSAGTDSVFVGPKCSVTLTSGNTELCIGQSVTVHASGSPTYSWSPGISNADSIQVLSPTVTTEYTVTGSNAYGCLKTNTIYVVVNPLPTVSLSLGFNDYICNTVTGPQTLVGSPPYGTYNGTGVINGNFYPQYLSAGTYNVTYSYTDFNSCTNSASDSVHVIACASGIKQYQGNESRFTIIPNPSNGNFTIETDIAQKQNISVFDVTGKLVLTQVIFGTTNIDAGNLAQGVYNVSINNGGSITNKRLVIVKQ